MFATKTSRRNVPRFCVRNREIKRVENTGEKHRDIVTCRLSKKRLLIHRCLLPRTLNARAYQTLPRAHAWLLIDHVTSEWSVRDVTANTREKEEQELALSAATALRESRLATRSKSVNQLISRTDAEHRGEQLTGVTLRNEMIGVSVDPWDRFRRAGPNGSSIFSLTTSGNHRRPRGKS